MNPGRRGADVALDSALEAAGLFAVDPHGLGGIALIAHASPARSAWLDWIRATLPSGVPWQRVPSQVADGALLGGLDLVATLSAGRPVVEQGLLARVDGGVLLVPMAERLDAQVAARMAAVMDASEVRLQRDGVEACLPARFGVVLMNEGEADDPLPPQSLVDRLAFQVDLSLVSARADFPVADPARTMAARRCLPRVEAGEDAVLALCEASLALGVASVRATLLALKAARAAAALDGAEFVAERHVVLAARLVLAHRATTVPQSAPERSDSDADQDQERGDPDDALHSDSRSDEAGELPQSDDKREVDREMVVEAVKSAIPAGMLSMLLSGSTPRSRARAPGRSGAAVKGGARGRPIGSCRGRPTAGTRLHVLDTLRAAAPWQRLRRRLVLSAKGQDTRPSRLLVSGDDFRVKRFQEKTQSATVFVVDASGSSALNRLAEAKGAVEMLLAESYSRRDHVALVAFRNAQAEIVLAPTRSLVKARRSLSGLPGGGGTPLAAAIDAAGILSAGLRRRGMTPTLVMLTDGKANVARDGQPGRERAHQDALAAARAFALCGVHALFVDTSPRPNPAALDVATAMRAHYLPLPHADAGSLSRAVRNASARN